MPSLTLNDFTRLAGQADASRLDTAFLKVRGGRLAETGRLGAFFTTQATRRATISAFADALRARYGGHVADMLNDTAIDTLRDGRTPLTARLVRELTGRADRMVQDLADQANHRAGQIAREAVKEENLAVVRAFVENTDPATGLNSAIAGFCGERGVTSDEDREIVLGWVRASLLDKADKNAFYPESLNLEVLHGSIFANKGTYASFSNAQIVSMEKTNPGTMHDRLHLADMGLGKTDLVIFTRCLEKLESMRGLQPQGEILPETVYQALFGTPPKGLDDTALIALIEARCAAEMRAVTAAGAHDKEVSKVFMQMWAPYMPWERLAALITHPSAVTRADVESVERLLASQGLLKPPSSRAEARGDLRKDPHRHEPPVPVPTFSVRFDDARTEIIEVGKETGFIFADDADKAAYLGGQGLDNSLARRLESLCQEICGGGNAPDPQVASAMACFTSVVVPLQAVGPLVGATMYEHTNVSVSLRRAEDGSGAILADLSTPRGTKDTIPQGIEDSHGRFRMSLSIATDGALTIKEFELAPPTAVLEQSAFAEAMGGAVTNAFGNMLRARDAGEARDQLDALGAFMLSAVQDHPPLANKTPGALAPAMERFMLLGAMRFMDKGDPQSFAAAIRRPGPFRDMLHALAGEKSASAEAARTTMQWFVKGLAGVLPDEALQACDGSRIRERDLSLARQREILGAGVHAARGAETASELAGLNESMREDMPGMEHFIRDAAEIYLREGPPSGQPTSLGLSHQFHADYPRRGVFVDGIYHHPRPESGTGTSEEEFIALFPDRRTAGLLSNLATQSLPALFQDAVMKKGATATSQAFVLGALGNPYLTGSDNEETFNARIETLDRSAGRYRIVGLHGRSTTNPDSAVERYMYEVAVDVNLGAPGADARSSPPPSVENVHVDFLIRGRGAVPGERNT